MTKIKAFFLLTIIILAYQYEFTTYADENIDSTLISGNLVNRTNSETDLSGIEVFMSVPDTTKPPSVTVTETEGRFRFALVESIAMYYMYAAGIGILVAGAINYVVNRRWTFGIKF